MWIGARLNTVALVVLSLQIGDGALGVGGMLAVQAMAIEVGEIVGPLLGGIILVLAGPSPPFILNGLSIAFLGFIVWQLPESVPGAHRVIEEHNVEAIAEVEAASKGGYRWLLKRPEVVTYLAMTLGSGALGYGIMMLFVTKALDIGLSEGSVGVFFSAIGAGALMGGISAGMGEYSNRRALILAGVASIAGALSIISFGFAGSSVLAVVALFFYGLVANLEEIPAFTYFQNRLPESIYGRFFSTFMMAASLGGLGGSLLIPYIAERNGMTSALATVGLPTMVFALLFAIRGGGLRLTRPFIPPVLANAQADISPAILPIEEATLADPEAMAEADFEDT